MVDDIELRIKLLFLERLDCLDILNVEVCVASSVELIVDFEDPD